MWVFGAAFAFRKESWHADLQIDVGAKGGAGLMSKSRNLTQFSLFLRWWTVCWRLCRLHGNRLCHFPYFGDKNCHANRSVQLQVVKWWVSCLTSEWLLGLWNSSCSLPTRLLKSSKHAVGMLRSCRLHTFLKIWECWSSPDNKYLNFVFLQTLPSSTSTSFLTAQREMMTSCISSSGRSLQRWARAPWPSPV